jgi:NAD(P)-dependent dehydrogenase (short-subunit alcohol dehydrogenase family)
MTTRLFDLADKVALVTGASRGIGEEIARVLASHGAHVIVSSRKLDGCQAVADSIIESGGRASAFPCHVGSMDDVAAMFTHIRETHGRLDILVNNAATNPYYGHILDTDLGSFQKTVDVNVRGYFFMSVEAGKLMRDNGGGAIVNTASVAGVQPSPGQGIYAVSKAAVINMTRAFAGECGEYNIRVNAILPGLTETKFAGALFDNPEFYNEAVRAIPLKRHASPAEMAGVVLMLVSEAGSYVNGECITVDGGLTATRL